MLGDDIQEALEEQEKNKVKKMKQEKEKNKNKNKRENNNISYSKENMKMPDDTIPGDSQEINKNEINISIHSKKKPPMKIHNNNINDNNINNINISSNQSKMNKKGTIPIPKSNMKYNSKSPDHSKTNKYKDINQNKEIIHHKRSNSNNEIKNISNDEIIKRIKESIADVDQRYLNPNFNLMSEIINVFGDVNFEKVKQDIERLKLVNEKLDDVIKIIVDKHSDEFFQILGYVRETKNIIEASKVIYDYAQVSLGNLTSNISSLAINENKEWKLQSIFLNEIITRLSKTLHIFEILHEL